MTYRFATAETPVLPMERARVFFDGIFSDPRLQHPECVAVGPDGWIWCGSENGEILRIDSGGSRIERVAQAGGLTLGLAFLGDEALFACDLRDATVYRLDLATRRIERFTRRASGFPTIPSSTVRADACSSPTATHFADPGPGVWAYDLGTGAGALWYDRPLIFANGMALAPEATRSSSARPSHGVLRASRSARMEAPARRRSFRRRSSRPAGRHCLRRCGRAFRRLLRAVAHPAHIAGRRTSEVYIEDPTAHLFAHPTNIAFDGSTLYTANLGRWHITRIDTDTSAPPLWQSTCTSA